MARLSDKLKNRKAVLRAEEEHPPTVEQEEFKGHLSIPLKDVEELDMAEPGDLVEIGIEGEVEDISENADETRYGIRVRRFFYITPEQSLEESEKAFRKEVDKRDEEE